MRQAWVFIMTFKYFHLVFFSSLLIFMMACSDTDNETELVELHTTANQDIMQINFPSDTNETILSINSQFDFTLQGLKTNGVDQVTISRDVKWSLSEGAISSIDQSGHFSAGDSTEMITVYAKFGYLTESIDIRVSSAKFDQVIQLDEQGFDIDMCQSHTIKPVARYIDDNGIEEIRLVDSNTINSIEWIIHNEEDNSLSQRAYIETINNQATINTLASGNITILAKARSLFSDSEVNSENFNHTIGNQLNSIKLCPVTDEDFSNCELVDPSIEKDDVLPIIAVGNYQANDGSTYNENITKNSKWGLSNALNASVAFSSDWDQLDITGATEGSTVLISAACGEVEQTIDDIELSEGVILENSPSCNVNADCLLSSALITIDLLSVSSFDVEANEIILIDDESVNLDTRPDEITFQVTANFSNNTDDDITQDNGLDYTIIDGQDDVIEIKEDSPGVFTVLGAGTTKIQLLFRQKKFIAIINIP